MGYIETGQDGTAYEVTDPVVCMDAVDRDENGRAHATTRVLITDGTIAAEPERTDYLQSLRSMAQFSHHEDFWTLRSDYRAEVMRAVQVAYIETAAIAGTLLDPDDRTRYDMLAPPIDGVMSDPPPVPTASPHSTEPLYVVTVKDTRGREHVGRVYYIETHRTRTYVIETERGIAPRTMPDAQRALRYCRRRLHAEQRLTVQIIPRSQTTETY